MKKIKYIALILVTATLYSCSLNSLPYSEVMDDNYFLDDNEIYAGVVGCYNSLYTVIDNEWIVTELRSDNTRISSSSSSSQTTVDHMYMDQNALLSSNPHLNAYWEACYEGIYSCNNVLQHVHKMTKPYDRKRLEGELRFMRSMLYFNLVRQWGPIFLMDKPISSLEARYKQRTPVDEVYQFIINDLTKIIDDDLLPARADIPGNDKGRVVMEAAKVLLAKVYVTHYSPGSSEYSAAGDLLSEVIVSCGNPQSGADLVPFDRIFSVANEMNDEIIFAVRYKSGKIGLGNKFGNIFAPSNSGSIVVIGDGSSYNYVTSNVINEFKSEPGDKRIDPSYAEGYFKLNGDWVSEDNTKGKARFIKKFLDPNQAEKNDGECDWPIIRMGDVLLLYAEVQNELMNPAEALKYLNIVRDRAGLEPETAMGTYDLRQAIRRERRKELAFENHRFYDLVRWGVAVDVLNNYVVSEAIYDSSTFPYAPIAEWNLLMPLPQKVMNINPDLAQNHGY